jgi:hypothetical protein
MFVQETNGEGSYRPTMADMFGIFGRRDCCWKGKSFEEMVGAQASPNGITRN